MMDGENAETVLEDLSDGALGTTGALGDLGVDAKLPLLAPFLDADELGAGLGENERADARRLGQAIHGCINRRDRYGRARAAVHLFVEVPEHDAGRRQDAGSCAHDFGDGDIDIAVRYYGARTDDQFRLQSNGVQGPGIGYPIG